MERLIIKWNGTNQLKSAVNVDCASICEDTFSCEERPIQKAVDKLAHYEYLEEQGLLLRLPCKVGDTVYRINQYAKEPIISMRISRIELVESLGGYSNFSIETINNEDKGEAYYYKREIGKVVFLTKAEAEKALEEMEK